jgi:hypothetical protein
MNGANRREWRESRGATPVSKPPKARPTLAVAKKSPDETDAAVLARTVLRSSVNAAAAALCFQNVVPGAELEFSALVDELADQCKQASDGNLGMAEQTLLAQAITLDQVFNNLLRRAAGNMGERPDAVDRYLKYGLRAQNQCRATLETLAAIKNPPVVFARQANIAHGHQQVNNGEPTRAREIQSEQSKLLEQTHGERLDTGATGAAGNADTHLEAVGAVHGASNSHG